MKIIRIILVVFVALLVFSSSAGAQSVSGFIEQETEFPSAGEAAKWLNVYVRGPVKGKVGWTVWSQTTKEWSETLVGLTYAPAKWVEVSGNIGFETDDNPLRYSGSAFFTKGRWSYLTIQENGGSGHWQRNILARQVDELFSLGVIQQTYVGTGIYIERRFGKKFSVYGTVVPIHFAENDDSLAMLVGRFSF